VDTGQCFGPSVLLGTRLGIEGVNPIYYNTTKVCLLLLQCLFCLMGHSVETLRVSVVCCHSGGSIALFVGSQADSPFYLDSHRARPAVPGISPFCSGHGRI
jgi:cysteine protease ATG4